MQMSLIWGLKLWSDDAVPKRHLKTQYCRLEQDSLCSVSGRRWYTGIQVGFTTGTAVFNTTCSSCNWTRSRLCSCDVISWFKHAQLKHTVLKKHLENGIPASGMFNHKPDIKLWSLRNYLDEAGPIPTCMYCDVCLLMFIDLGTGIIINCTFLVNFFLHVVFCWKPPGEQNWTQLTM